MRIPFTNKPKHSLPCPHYLVHVGLCDYAEARKGGLQVIQRVAHVALRREHDRIQAVRSTGHLRTRAQGTIAGQLRNCCFASHRLSYEHSTGTHVFLAAHILHA